jgi:hypothetical protein
MWSVSTFKSTQPKNRFLEYATLFYPPNIPLSHFYLFTKALFEYIYNHLQNTKKALELASYASAETGFKDWWWKLQMAKCYIRLKLYNDAEKQLKSSLIDQVFGNIVVSKKVS